MDFAVDALEPADVSGMFAEGGLLIRCVYEDRADTLGYKAFT